MCSNYRPFVYLQLNNFNLIAINWANLIKWRLIQHSIWTGDCLNVHHLRRRYEIAIRSPLRGGRRQPKNHQSVELNTEQRWRDEQKEQKKIIKIVKKKKKRKKKKKKKEKVGIKGFVSCFLRVSTDENRVSLRLRVCFSWRQQSLSFPMNRVYSVNTSPHEFKSAFEWNENG